MGREEIARYRARLARLKKENIALVKRQRDLEDIASVTGTDEQLVALMNDNAVAVLEPTVQLRMVAEQLDANRRAQGLLSHALGREELAAAYQQAIPLFERTVAHVKPLADALTAVARILREAEQDLRAFEAAANHIAGLASQHPDQRPSYDESQLAVIRHWRADFLGDLTGLNPSRLERWRDLLREVGLA